MGLGGGLLLSAAAEEVAAEEYIPEAMRPALSDKDPAFVLWASDEFSAQVHAAFQPSPRSPHPAIVLGDFDGDGHQDAVLIGYNETMRRSLVINYSLGREPYSGKPGNGYLARNWISVSGGPGAEPRHAYLSATTRSQALQDFGEHRCRVDDNRLDGIEDMFVYHSQEGQKVFALWETRVIPFCTLEHTP